MELSAIHDATINDNKYYHPRPYVVIASGF